MIKITSVWFEFYSAIWWFFQSEKQKESSKVQKASEPEKLPPPKLVPEDEAPDFLNPPEVKKSREKSEKREKTREIKEEKNEPKPPPAEPVKTVSVSEPEKKVETPKKPPLVLPKFPSAEKPLTPKREKKVSTDGSEKGFYFRKISMLLWEISSPASEKQLSSKGFWAIFVLFLSLQPWKHLCWWFWGFNSPSRYDLHWK